MELIMENDENLRQLHQILEYAQKNVPFFKSKIDHVINNKTNINCCEILKKLPILKKEDYYSNQNLMLSKEYLLNELCIEKTSGSSGQPFTIYKTETDKLRQLKESWKFRNQYYGIKPNDRFCRFTYSKKTENNKHTVIKNNILYLNALEMSDTIMDEFTIEINNFKPVWFFTTPSTIYYYLNHLKNNKKSIPLEHQFSFIELTGEKVSQYIKQDIEKYFQCSVGNNYGTTETYPIAMECPCGHLHVIDNNIYIEVVDDNLELIADEELQNGNIVVTSYNNTAMPFIRYWLGDKVTYIKNFKCPCGNTSPILELNNVRFTDKIKLKDHRLISPVFFCILIDEICSKYNCCVFQFQVIQKTYEIFDMKIAIKDTEQKHQLVKDLQNKTLRFLKEKVCHNATLNISIESKSSLKPNSFTGKLTYFKSLI